MFCLSGVLRWAKISLAHFSASVRTVNVIKDKDEKSTEEKEQHSLVPLPCPGCHGDCCHGDCYYWLVLRCFPLEGRLHLFYQESCRSWNRSYNPRTNKQTQCLPYSLTPSSLAEIFRFENKAYNLRNRDFGIPTFETITYGKHSIRYLGPYIWAKRSKIDKDKLSLKSFRSNIRKTNLSSLIENNCNSCKLRCMYVI